MNQEILKKKKNSSSYKTDVSLVFLLGTLIFDSNFSSHEFYCY